MVVTVPEVPSRWSCRVQSPIAQPVLARIAQHGVDVTDHGSEHSRRDDGAAEALGQRHDAHRQRGPGDAARIGAVRRPASTRRARSARTSRRRCRTEAPSRHRASISEAQPATASRASVSRSMISMSRPVSLAPRWRGSPGRWQRRRQASVAISRKRSTLPPAHLVGADLQCLDGALDGASFSAAGRRDALARAGRCARTHR